MSDDDWVLGEEVLDETPNPENRPMMEGRELLRREWELIQREKDLLAREQELLATQRRTFEGRCEPEQNRERVAFRDIPAEVIPLFDPDDAKSLTSRNWIRRAEEIADAFEWTNGQLLARAADRLRGPARIWYSTTIDTVATWRQFAESLTRAFAVETDVARTHAELAARSKRRGGSYATYAYEMLALAHRGGVDERTTTGYILRGLDSNTASALATRRYMKVEELLAAIETYTSQMSHRLVPEQNFAFKRHNTKPAPMAVPNKRDETVETEREMSVRSTPEVRRDRGEFTCYRCGEVGHTARTCSSRNRQSRCYLCRQLGHKMSECPAKQTTVQVKREEVPCVNDTT